MSKATNPQVSGQFLYQTADALRHYYDSAYLAGHPILTQLRDLLGNDRIVAVQRLRWMLLDAVEELRPQHGTPSNSPAWRPYSVLHGRYILGKSLDTLETELGLSRRQIQREQRTAFATVAINLWARRANAAPEEGLPGPHDSILQEISRVASEEQAFDAAPEIEGALQLIRGFARHSQVELITPPSTTTAYVLGNPDLLRQLLVSALSLAVRAASAAGSSVRVEGHPTGVVCSIYANDNPASAAPPQHVPLPEPLRALAQANGATLTQEGVAGAWRLLIELRAAPKSYTVVIVEDNKDLARLYSRYLAGRGYRLIEVSDSMAAMERIAEIMPDAVVLDLMMSHVDGWRVLQRLQEDRSLRHIPVAVCSVLNEPELARSLGARAYLRKPVRPAELLECLVSLLERTHNAGAGSSPAPR